MIKLKILLLILMLLFFCPVCSHQAVLLEYFWNEDCGACKLVEPMLEEIKSRYGDNVVIKKYNTRDPTSRPFIDKYNVEFLPHIVVDEHIALVKYQEIKANLFRVVQEELEAGGIPISLPSEVEVSSEGVIFLRDLAKTNIERVDEEILNVRSIGMSTSKPRELLASARDVFLAAETFFERDDLVNAAREYQKANSLAEEAYSTLIENERIYAKSRIDEASGVIWALKQSIERAKKEGEDVSDVSEKLARAEYQLSVAWNAFEEEDYVKAISWAKTTIDTSENVKQGFYESRLTQLQKDIYYYSQQVESKQKEMYEEMKRAKDKKRLADYYKNDTRLYRDWYEVYQTKIMQKKKELDELSIKTKIWKGGIGLILGSMLVFSIFRRIRS
ncbi:MAG: thioredoxin domain-containing protein [Candidatus Hydrothermarchaeota archaeon]